MTQPSVHVQISPETVPSTPSWLGEIAVVAHLFTKFGLVQALEEQVQLTRGRFGKYEVIDFVLVLLGYVVSGEQTLEAYFARLAPFSETVMALFDRTDLPHPSTLSRFLDAIDVPCVEALRVLFQKDLLNRTPFASPGGLWDRSGQYWIVVDIDGTKQTARQRPLLYQSAFPSAHRRMGKVCAPGYFGRKRGEVGRTRTTVLQPFTHQWLGTFSGAGNGDYRGELKQAFKIIVSMMTAQGIPLSQVMLRLDGLYGNRVVVVEILQQQVAAMVRFKDYAILDQPEVQARLQAPPDQQVCHPETGTSRTLYDCPDVLLTPTGPRVRLIIATHLHLSKKKPSVGSLRVGTVYELFVATAPQQAFTPSDVLGRSLHRGSFETVIFDEDVEQDADRWASHTACGQEFYQILNQWVWEPAFRTGAALGTIGDAFDGVCSRPGGGGGANDGGGASSGVGVCG